MDRANKSEVQNPDGTLVTVELQSSSRPIRVKIHTLLSGGPVMVRWLEITNNGTVRRRSQACRPGQDSSGTLQISQRKLQPDSEDVYDVGLHTI